MSICMVTCKRVNNALHAALHSCGITHAVIEKAMKVNKIKQHIHIIIMSYLALLLI